MKSAYKTGLCLLLTGAFLLQSSSGRTIVKRSPQLTLTVVDEPEDEEMREHPPSPEDIEERRVKLVKALIPGGDGGGGGALGSQLSSLSNLGVDLLSGGRISEIFSPLVNATRKATAGFPRAGDVINRVIDSAREYRKSARSAVRETASAKVNSGVKVFSTVTARATELLGGVFKLLRTLLDNFTYSVQNLARTFSTGLAGFTKNGSQFLARNFARARNLLNNQRLFQPAKDAAALGGNLFRGLAEDFTSLQPAVSDVVKTKLSVSNRFIPRVRLTSILSPLGDAEPCNDDVHGEDAVDVGDGGYGKKRGSSESSESNESGSGEAKGSTMSIDDIPKDVLELLESSKSEAKANPEGDATTTAASKTTSPTSDSNEISETKQVPKSTATIKTTTSATPSKTAAKSNKTIIKETTTATVKATPLKTSSSAPKKSPSSGSGGRTSVVEDLFGLNS